MIRETKCLDVPHLRFPEFSEEWEICKVSELLDFYSTNSLSWEQLEYGTKAMMNLHYGLIHVGLPTMVDLTRDNLPNIKEDNMPKNFELCKEGDVAFADASEDTNEVAKPIEFFDLAGKNIVCGLHTIHGRDNKNKTVIGFKGYAFSSSAFHNQIRRIAQGTKIYSISTKNFSECFIGIPSKVEQTKIATLLRLIDERIATQNKIIEDLKKLKSAIIEKTFNENYSNKIRLRDVGSYIRGLTYSSDDVVESNGIFVMRSNNIINGSSLDYHNNIVSVNKQILTEQQLQTGDIVICMANGSSSLVGKSSFYDGDCSTPITVGAFCGIYRSKEPIVKWLFQTNKYRRYIWNSLQGGNGAIANLNGDDILRMSFSIPATPAKDNRIKLLTSVDTLLESNISLCDLYISQKLYLLRQMFI
ncbi:restriction endonuclease subunit S [Escherichia coli]|uniref:Restriction endonuclease subunit S n=1 Tax=Phocaeicola vulgatus TaxID=821 RepID=A0A7J5S1U6_PHOVU|nr:restriction endonuclease subunit S [Phocaeicola vulgatus]MZV02632.1 restriction endonuclease subunit S [Escherichia coli]KAB3752302.1 restriction endonuclease subunit S [Phocaeicola vulgatus]KAB3764459.1 restriction endonuclease subunit S [Phocaeicola vulgatus]KAB3765667.1 restriction endonuclease subunit S [Phocaeicola vulgatus]